MQLCSAQTNSAKQNSTHLSLTQLVQPKSTLSEPDLCQPTLTTHQLMLQLQLLIQPSPFQPACFFHTSTASLL